MITRFGYPLSITSVLDMEGIQSDLGRVSSYHVCCYSDLVSYMQGRAWIMLSLVQKQLASFVNSLLAKQDSLKKLYYPGGFLISEELTELAGNLRCLDAIDFK